MITHWVFRSGCCGRGTSRLKHQPITVHSFAIQFLQMVVLDGNMYDQTFLEVGSPVPGATNGGPDSLIGLNEGQASEDTQLERCLLLMNNKVRRHGGWAGGQCLVILQPSEAFSSAFSLIIAATWRKVSIASNSKCIYRLSILSRHLMTV